jgi:hypothetical protein
MKAFTERNKVVEQPCSFCNALPPPPPHAMKLLLLLVLADVADATILESLGVFVLRREKAEHVDFCNSLVTCHLVFAPTLG